MGGMELVVAVLLAPVLIFAVWLLLRSPRHPVECPTTLEEALVAIEALRLQSRLNRRAWAVVLVVVPLLTWLVLTIGDREREHNCDVNEDALLDYNEGLVQRFIDISKPRESLPPAEQVIYDEKVRVLRDGGADDIHESMEDCGG